MTSDQNVCAEIISELSNLEHKASSFHKPDTPAAIQTIVWRNVRDIVELAQLERMAIESALSLCEGSISKAAGFLGVSPSTIYRKRGEWSLASQPIGTSVFVFKPMTQEGFPRDASHNRYQIGGRGWGTANKWRQSKPAAMIFLAGLSDA